jgi:hypothetical protein
MRRATATANRINIPETHSTINKKNATQILNKPGGSESFWRKQNRLVVVSTFRFFFTANSSGTTTVQLRDKAKIRQLIFQSCKNTDYKNEKNPFR